MLRDAFKGLNVCVLGFGRSGKSAVEVLSDLGANVTLTTNEIISDDDARRKLHALDVEIIDGHHPLSILNTTDLIVKNPGIPFRIEFLQEALKRNIPIITDVEIASAISNSPIVGITGTNGKTTVTHLLGEFLLAAGKRPILCGNIGYPASSAAKESTPDDILIMELSSFQLMSTIDFKVDVAIFTNIYEAHIDYHETLTGYQNAKLKLLDNMTSEDLVIFFDDQKEFIEHLSLTSEVQYFSVTTPNSLIGIDEHHIVYKGENIIHLDEVALKGVHNHENILAAILAAKRFDVSNDSIREVLRTFSGINHRMEYVNEVNGVKYYNDSKATNNLATSFALRSFNTPIIWIAGGLNRNQDFGELLPYIESVTHLIAYGETKEMLKQFAKENHIDVTLVENPYDAVLQAFEIANSGDTVLFSPACASWDQYKDYEARGNHYKDAVAKISMNL